MSSTLFKKGEKKPNQGKRGPAKTTLIAKEAIAIAAEGLGGVDRLIEWAKEEPKNESAFWTSIYTKLLPLQVNAEINGRVLHGILKVPPKDARSD
jgi:hypothetical protein